MKIIINNLEFWCKLFAFAFTDILLYNMDDDNKYIANLCLAALSYKHDLIFVISISITNNVICIRCDDDTNDDIPKYPLNLAKRILKF